MNKENKRFIVETVFLKEALKYDLSLKEFVLLMYFDNNEELVFDVKKVSKATCLSETDILTTFGILLDKKLLVLKSEKNESGKLIDRVSLDNFYKDIKEQTKIKETKNDKDNIFTKFQVAYAKTLSSMDYELINGWLQCGYSEDLILGALKEANLYGKASLRYIDTILFEWNKKGFKDMNDVNNHLIKRDTKENKELYSSSVMDYNWLDDDE